MGDLTARTLVAILFGLWQGSMYVAVTLRPTTPQKSKAKLRRILYQGLMICATNSFVLCQLMGYNLGHPMHISPYLAAVLRWAGLWFLALGIVGTVWTRFSRGETWAIAETDPSEIQEHRLITSGPHRIVRHPFYLSFCLLFIGLQLAFTKWLVLATLIMIPHMMWTAKKEEKALEKSYGGEWRAYKQQVPFFFPLRVPSL